MLSAVGHIHKAFVEVNGRKGLVINIKTGSHLGPYPISDKQGHIANRIPRKQTPIRHDAHDADHVRVSSKHDPLTRRPIDIARNYSVCGNLHLSYVH